MGEGTPEITAIYLTLNRMPECWSVFHMKHLKAALQDIPVISVSRLPLDFGTNLIDEGPYSYANIYWQILRASKLATTKYIAVTEDDTLYHENHFRRFLPADDEFAYNRCRWSLFSWGPPQYSLRRRISNCGCIAPRELMIEALTERFEKCGRDIPPGRCGECGRHKLEKMLGITKRKAVDFYSRIPIVQLSHPSGSEDRQQIMRKSHAEIRAFDIPYWGKAEDVVKHYTGE
jgi:hypothetical protein